jgi:hypothetical protein
MIFVGGSFWCMRQFLGAFAKIAKKAIISFVMSVRPFVSTEQLGSHSQDFNSI